MYRENARIVMERLKVYYGWSKLGKVRKKRSLCIMFENDLSCRKERGMRVLNTMMNSVIERYQDAEEAKEGRLQNRIFTKYELFLDEKPFYGSLSRLLSVNSEADRNHASKELRDRISDALRKAFTLEYPDYKEPGSQLSLNL